MEEHQKDHDNRLLVQAVLNHYRANTHAKAASGSVHRTLKTRNIVLCTD